MKKQIRSMAIGLAALALPIIAAAQTLPKGDPKAAEFRDNFLAGKLSWEEVLDRAKTEGKVNWFIWGGNELLNNWTETFVAPEMQKLGVKLTVSRIANTRDAVDLVVADNAAGRGIGQGTVDAIWVNGANFQTLGQQNALLGSFATKLPSAKYFDLDPNSVKSRLNLYDFGYSTEGREMPWSAEQYICYIDTARLPRKDAPIAFKDLESYVRAHPGRFSYVNPPNFNGNTFVETVLYATNPDGYKPFQRGLQEYTSAEFTRVVTPGFEFLRRIEPFLVGGGGKDGARGSPVYPENPVASYRMLANGEIDMGCGFGLYSVPLRVKDGTFPPTAETLPWPKEGMIANKNYIAIPNNSPDPAAALVLANLLASPEGQITKLATVGYPLGLEFGRLSQADQARVTQVAPKLVGTTLDELAERTVPDFNASLVNIIETAWIDYIERQSTKPLGELIDAAFAKRK